MSMSHAHASSAGPSNSQAGASGFGSAYQASSPSPKFETPSPSVGNNHDNHNHHHRHPLNNTHALDFDDSLTLPPIIPNNHQYAHNYDFDDDHLPSLDDSHFFDAYRPLPRMNSPPPRDSTSRHLLPPPPSNQQAGLLPEPQRSFEYTYSHSIPDSSSPDPFSDLFLPPSPPAEGRSRTPPRTNPVVDLTESSPLMPPNKKRKTEGSVESSTPKNPRRSARTVTPRSSQDTVEIVDLEKVEGKKDYADFQAKQQAEAIRKQNVDESNKPVKLAEFQCIICMDNPTDLTVTHCGHLFCSECLHSALNAGDKRSCPVCRTVINMGRPGGKPPKNGAFPLEMKLMTANKKGKQPVKH